MADNKKLTIFQRLGRVVGADGIKQPTKNVIQNNKYTLGSNELLKTTDKTEFDKAKLQAQQNILLGKVWKSVGGALTQNQLASESTRIGSYIDFENMEYYPLISAALDIMSEEACLNSDTVIPLLNGTNPTIKDLYEKNIKDFWVYAIDTETNTIKPSKVDKVIFKGLKDSYKITLDDNSEIICTDNHKWLTFDNKWIETKDLTIGSSLKSISTRISNLGYEKISLTNFKGDTKFTHIMVAENELISEKQKLLDNPKLEDDVITIHHKSFDKRNNDPNELQYMFWTDHQKLHTSLNTERWSNPEFANKMKKIFSETAIKTWENSDKKERIKKLRNGLKRVLETTTKKEFFGRKGEQNGMYGSARFGKLNPNYNHSKNHISDINEEEYINFVSNTTEINRRKAAMNKFNLTKGDVVEFNKQLVKKYNLNRIEDLDFLFNKGYDINNIKNYVAAKDKPKNLFKQYCNEYNIKPYKLSINLKQKGYNSWRDLVSTIGNHRITKIEYVGKSEVFDLANSSVSQNFAVKCNNGMIISHNCTLNNNGRMMNIYSDSKRVKQVLEDLFFNRLDLHTSLPMWTRNVCKYGDNFVLLNIDDKMGITGARQMPNFEMLRKEGDFLVQNNDEKDNKVKFIWNGRNAEFNSWQMAHFRLLSDDRKLPYGTSIMEKARKIWKQLIMSEDAMLVYRITRAPERRVYKVYVGNIDEGDVQAYVNEIANRFKRTPLIDPQTGQMDLKYNQLGNDQDFFIPVRSEDAPNPIDTLQGAQNLDQIADIEYLRDNLFTAIRVPKTFLGFEDSKGEGKNLSLQDVRFARTINRIQQTMLQELNKIAIIHLYLLGYEDDLDNFTLTLNNPSTQAEMLKVEHEQIKVTLYKDAVSDAGNGFGTMSMTRGKREILGWSDDEIKQDLLEQRMEKAASAELANTTAVIKHTGTFDSVDKIYGDIDKAREGASSEGEESGGESGGGSAGAGGGFGGGGLGSEDLDFGDESEAGAGEGNEETGNEQEGGATAEAGAEQGTEAESTENTPDNTLAEGIQKKLDKKKKLLTNDLNKKKKKHTQNYNDKLSNYIGRKSKEIIENIKIEDKNLRINEDVNNMIKGIDNLLDDKKDDFIEK